MLVTLVLLLFLVVWQIPRHTMVWGYWFPNNITGLAFCLTGTYWPLFLGNDSCEGVHRGQGNDGGEQDALPGWVCEGVGMTGADRAGYAVALRRAGYFNSLSLFPLYVVPGVLVGMNGKKG